MKKKLYNQPQTEITHLIGGYMMQSGLVLSPGAVTDPSNPPAVHAPKRGDLIP